MNKLIQCFVTSLRQVGANAPSQAAIFELKDNIMKTRNLGTMLAIVAVASLTWSASTALAQDSSAVAGIPQVVRLSQAQVNENTIIAYVNRSGLSYNLTADQIISLRQQGVSDAVITAMLSQPPTAAPTVTTYAPPAPAPQVTQTVVAPAVTAVPTTTIVSPVTYVQPLPAPAYYYQPSYAPAPSYGWFSPIALSFAWGSSSYHGGGYYGGWHGGWHH
jgi:hypothetical protein